LVVSTPSKGGCRGCYGTYIAQILQDVVKILRLLVFIAQFLNRIPRDKVLGDLGPHVTLLLLSGRWIPFAVIEDLDTNFGVSFALAFPRCRCRWLRDNNTLTWSSAGSRGAVREELRSSDTRVLRPCHFCCATTCTIHADAFCAGWDIDDFPVSGGAMECLAWASACVDARCDVVAFIVVVGGWRGNRGSGVGPSTIAGGVMMVIDVHFQVPTLGAHQDLIVMVMLRWWAATLNRWRASAAAGMRMRMSVDVDFCFPAGGVDVDFSVAFPFGLSLAHRGWWGQWRWRADLDDACSCRLASREVKQ
jgi:hypothetical protein